MSVSALSILITDTHNFHSSHGIRSFRALTLSGGVHVSELKRTLKSLRTRNPNLGFQSTIPIAVSGTLKTLASELSIISFFFFSAIVRRDSFSLIPAFFSHRVFRGKELCHLSVYQHLCHSAYSLSIYSTIRH